MAFKDSLSSLGRNRALIIAFLAVLILVFYFDGLRNFLTSQINDPFAMLVLGSAPWVTEFFGWARLPVHWLLMAIEVVVLVIAATHLLKALWWALPERTDTTGMPPERVRKIQHRRHVLAWVFTGAISSALFAIMTVAIPLATYYAKWLTPAAAEAIFANWPYVILAEVIMQIIPMNVRQQTQGWDVVTDQWTSFLPMLGCAVVLTAMFFGGFAMDERGWKFLSWSFLTAVIELLLLAVSNKLIAAARGSEETQV